MDRQLNQYAMQGCTVFHLLGRMESAHDFWFRISSSPLCTATHLLADFVSILIFTIVHSNPPAWTDGEWRGWAALMVFAVEQILATTAQ